MYGILRLILKQTKQKPRLQPNKQMYKQKVKVLDNKKGNIIIKKDFSF